MPSTEAVLHRRERLHQAPLTSGYWQSFGRFQLTLAPSSQQETVVPQVVPPRVQRGSLFVVLPQVQRGSLQVLPVALQKMRLLVASQVAAALQLWLPVHGSPFFVS